MYVFVHVPKTAGTSLREALCANAAVKKAVFDYGLDSPKTSHLVTATIYNDDPPAFKRALDAENVDLLAGHFPARKYEPLLPDALYIAFVRDPLERCYSEYLHHRRHNGLKSEFSAYLRKPEMINLQSRFLGGLPESAVVGVTEFYTDSLRLLSAALGFKVALLKKNMHRPRLDTRYAATRIEADVAAEFRTLNGPDFELYRHYRDKFHREVKKLA